MCIDYGNEGSYCGAYCEDGHDCPEGYACEDETLADGAETRQCVIKDDVCSCNELGMALGMKTICLVHNAHGACEGERACGTEGLGMCDAPIPKEETCDGQDNDCNGITDDLAQEKSCFIENEYGKCLGVIACVGTVELCTGDTPKPEVCDGLDNDCNGYTDDGFQDKDDDGLADCVDKDMDGDGVDNEMDNCLQVPNLDQADLDKDDKGDACDSDKDGDGFADTVDCLPLDVLGFPGALEACDGKDNDCDGVTDEDLCKDDLECTFDYCIPATGECGHAPDDAKCDDKDTCTLDVCNVEEGCQAIPLSGVPCDDDNLCTMDDVCEAGECVGSPAAGCCNSAADCDDLNTCTTDVCDKPTGLCSHLVLDDDSVCDADGDGCTKGDKCWQGVCIPGPRVFCGEDDDICAKDECLSLGPHSHECVTIFAGNETPCDDELFCTVDDHCDGDGGCTGGGPRVCPQQEGGCMLGVCDDSTDECLTQDKDDGESCNADDDGCTSGDECSSGVCIPGPAPDCSSAAEDTCETGVCESLGPEFHVCSSQPKPTGASCEDDNFCTVDDRCNASGECQAGEPRDCDAEVGDECHFGVCDDYMQECVKWKAGDGTPCDDGDECTTIDVCENGFCVGATDVCVAEEISVSDTGARRPAVVSLGSGRYVTQWFGTGGYGTRENHLRLSDAYGSRENEEITLPPIKTGRQFATGMAVTQTGNFLALHWGGVNECNAANCNACTAVGSFTGSLFMWDGSLVKEKTLQDYTLETGDGCGAHLEVSAARAIPLSFSDGTFGLLDAYEVSGELAQGDASKPPRQVRFSLVASDMTPGASTALIAASGIASADGFDAASVPDGSDSFLTAWIGPDRLSVRVRRFYSTGTPASAQWEAVEVSGTETITDVRILTLADGGAMVLYEVEDSSMGLTHVAGRLFDSVGTPKAGEFVLDPSVDSSRRLGGVGEFSDGGFVVVYGAENGDLDGWAVRALFVDPTGVPQDDVMTVNTDYIGDQHLAEVAVLTDDDWLVAFVDSDSSVWTRRMTRDGKSSVGRPEYQVNTTIAGPQTGLEIARSDMGRIMAVYESPQFGAEGTEILARVFDIQGDELLSEFTVNQVHGDDQRNPKVVGDGAFVVAWESVGQDGSGNGVFARRYDQLGHAIGDEFQVNETFNQDQTEPALDVDPNGSVLFTWSCDMDGSGNDTDVMAVILGENGSVVKGEFTVNTTLELRQTASAVGASPAGGGFAVVWESENQDGYSYGVYARRFDESGSPLSGEVLVNQTTVYPQRFPTLSVSPDGERLAICWTSSVNYEYDIVCRVLNFPDLSAAAGEFTPHVQTKVDQQEPDVAFLPNGEFLVAWSAGGVDGSGTAVQVQRFTTGAQPFGPRLQVNRTFAEDQRAPTILPMNAGIYWMGWESFGQDGDQDGGIFRMLPVQ